MKKVLIFGMSENLGGVETVIMNYYRNLNKNKVQCDFLYNTESIAYAEEIAKMGGKTYKITPRAKGIKKYKKEMNEFFENHSKEYVAIWVNLCTLCNIDWLKYAKKYGIKNIILHSHNSKNMVNKVKFLMHKVNKMLINKYTTDFWACSKEAGKFFYNKRTLNSEKFKIVNNAINVKEYEFDQEIRAKYRKKLNLENELVIGHIGRFHFQKNHDFLIDIFEEINEINGNTHLLLIGKGEEEEKTRIKVKEKQLESKVTFLGLREDIKQLYQAMDVFILPSLFEGLPLVLLEAQVNGIDTYASKEGIPELAKMSNNFYFLSLKDEPKKWANIILEKEHNRENDLESIRKCGYDIREETKKIEEFFEKIN